MILDEVIERYTRNAEYERTHGNLQGCLEFRQLAEWLKELKENKDVLDKIRAKIEEPLNINKGLNTESAKAQAIALSWCIEIIDKYREGEG